MNIISPSPKPHLSIPPSSQNSTKAPSSLPERGKLTAKERWKAGFYAVSPTPVARLTLKAAKFMYDQCLVMRNSYTKQLLSLHYGHRSFPETHSSGGGQYGVPLWTVALKSVRKDYSEFNLPDANSIFANTTVGEQQQYLDSFLEKIKDFFQTQLPFGSNFRGDYFDYELLIAKPLNPTRYLSDIGSYSTGGRSHSLFNSTTIIYRITLNAFEIEFIKAILRGKSDYLIAGMEEGSIRALALRKTDHIRFLKTEYNCPIPDGDDPSIVPIIMNSVRYILCHRLCIEIIAEKLVLFLNAASEGKTDPVITLNSKKLSKLLQVSLEKEALNIKKTLQDCEIHIIAPYKSSEDYLGSMKYPSFS